MKQILSVLLCLTIAIPVQATVHFVETFDSYSNGNLVGQGPWNQTGATATNPIQVNNGTAVIGPTGQDVYAALDTPAVISIGSPLYIGATISLTAAQASGDYFLHWTPSVGNGSIFQERIFARSSGAGYVLGISGSSGGATLYSSTVLSLNTAYRLVLNYTSVPGLTNDMISLYIDPSDNAVEGNNSPYLVSNYNATGAETNNVLGINFRQGGSSAGPTVVIDDLIVASTFSEVAVIPEPSAVAFATIGLVGLFALRRRR